MPFSKQDDLIQQQQNAINNSTAVNSSRYKTELCRSFMESTSSGDNSRGVDVGYCRYKDKCQFAHGMKELRSVQRHPKYKTEPCKSYYSMGFCCYGKRCHFIHDELFYQANFLEVVTNMSMEQGQQQIQDFNNGAFVAVNNQKLEEEKLLDYSTLIAAAGTALNSNSPSSYSSSSGSSSPNSNNVNNLYFGSGGSMGIW